MEFIDRRDIEVAHVHPLHPSLAVVLETLHGHFPEFVIVLAREDAGGRGGNERLRVQRRDGLQVGFARQSRIELALIAVEQLSRRGLNLVGSGFVRHGDALLFGNRFLTDCSLV
ncbi:hypothetical protein D9M72_472730 [compost metagenome]